MGSRKLDNKKEHAGLKLDQEDRKNLENALKIYERMNPPGKVRTAQFPNPKTGQEETWIEYCNIEDHMRYMRNQVIDNKRGAQKFHMGSVGRTESGTDTIRVKVSVPPSLEQWLNKAYPMLFADALQTDQFIKWFPIFDLTR